MCALQAGTAMWGVSANTTPTRVTIHTRKEESLVQHDSVASVCSNFKSLTLGSLFQAYLSMENLEGKTFLMIINSLLCAQ